MLQVWLHDAGDTVTPHTAPAAALADPELTASDLLTLDVLRPASAGRALCQQIRPTATTPILQLSAAPMGRYLAAAAVLGKRWRASAHMPPKSVVQYHP